MCEGESFWSVKHSKDEEIIITSGIAIMVTGASLLVLLHHYLRMIDRLMSGPNIFLS